MWELRFRTGNDDFGENLFLAKIAKERRLRKSEVHEANQPRHPHSRHPHPVIPTNAGISGGLG